MSQNNLRHILNGHRLIPVVTFHDKDDVIAFAEFLLDQQVRIIEVTLRNEFGLNAIKTISNHFGEKMLVGAGTVTNADLLKKAEIAGARFAVSPGLSPDLAKAFSKSKIAYLPGISTPSEIITALDHGIEIMKLFPANLFGGRDALKAYGSVFPQVKFCPTGGITRRTANAYLELPNVIAVGGSWFQTEFKR